MSFTSIPNQPIIFRSQDEVLTPCVECGNSEYNQLIDFNDQIFFQIESTPCEQKPIQTFFNQIYEWTNEFGNVCGTGTENGLYANWYYIDYEYQMYSVKFQLINIDAGALYVKLNGSVTYELTLAGTYTLYFNNPSIIDGSYIDLIFESNNFLGCFYAPSIQVLGIGSKNQMKLGIVDAVTLETIDVITPLYTTKDNKITGAFDLTDVAVDAGCYRLAIADFCENTCNQFKVTNGLFTLFFGSIYGWTSGGTGGGTITFTQNNVFFNLGVGGSDAFISNTTSELCTGKYYYISIVVESRSSADIKVSIGDNEATFPAGTGYITTALFAGAPNINGTKLIITASQVGAFGGSVNISKVDVQIDDDDIQWNKYSDVLSIGEYSDPCKYFKIEGCNAEDQFNLAFGGSSFLPMIRLEGKRAKAQYVTNANTFRYASGKWSANYVNRLKQWTYHFGRLPEYVLDFLSTIFYYDNCYVNGKLMFPQDNAFPTIDWSDADGYLGSFNIDLIEKDNKVVKVQCGDSDANCLPSILNLGDEPFLLLQDDNRMTTQDSVNLYYEN